MIKCLNHHHFRYIIVIQKHLLCSYAHFILHLQLHVLHLRSWPSYCSTFLSLSRKVNITPYLTVSYDKFTPFYQFTLSLSYVSIPRLYQKVMLVLAWQHAMNKEMQALRLSDPYATSMVGCPWVYTIKFNLDSSVNRYTARLVVKGFSYTYGVDYFKIFSPMALLNSIHILFS